MQVFVSPSNLWLLLLAHTFMLGLDERFCRVVLGKLNQPADERSWYLLGKVQRGVMRQRLAHIVATRGFERPPR
jgi:hypothetical protein